MYKCEYCDSVFTSYHNTCPNCGGNSWLTSRKPDQTKSGHPLLEGIVSIILFGILAILSLRVICYSENGALELLKRLYDLVFSL